MYQAKRKKLVPGSETIIADKLDEQRSREGGGKELETEKKRKQHPKYFQVQMYQGLHPYVQLWKKKALMKEIWM